MAETDNSTRKAAAMSAQHSLRLMYHCQNLSYADADEIARRAMSSDPKGLVVLDLQETNDTSTAALARLLLLRRQLLAARRDVRIIGLHGRANSLYQLARLGPILPRAASDNERGVNNPMT